MPLYEYECDSCGKVFDRIQKFSDPPVEVCEFCGGKVHKLFSPPVFIFKGSGWYVTDYANKHCSTPDNGRDKQKESGNGKKDKVETEVAKKTGDSEGSNFLTEKIITVISVILYQSVLVILVSVINSTSFSGIHPFQPLARLT